MFSLYRMDKVSSPVESYSSMISEDFHQSDEMDDQDKSSTRYKHEKVFRGRKNNNTFTHTVIIT